MAIEPSTFIGTLIPARQLTQFDGSWADGPLPIPLPTQRGARSGDASRTDRSARLTLISETAGEVLYPNAGPRRRVHRTFDQAMTNGEPAPIAIEFCSSMFVPDQAAGFLILHFELPGAPDLTAVSALIRQVSAKAGDTLGLVGIGDQVEVTGRVAHIAHVVWQDPLPPLLPGSDWPVEDQWMHYLVAADTPEHRLPDEEKSSLQSGRIRLSRDWTALVMRDGMAMLATTPLTQTSFHEHARVHARSVYLDAFLLGLIQRDAAQALDREAAHAMAHVADISPTTPENLEESLLSFRSRLWVGHVADRGGNVEEITRAVQAQYRLPELVAKITTDLGEIARFMQARATRQREQIAWILGLVTAVFVIPSLVFSGAEVLTDPSLEAFLACVAISLVLLLAVWGAWRRYGSRWTASG